MKALSDLAVLHYVIDASEEIASCIAEREGCKWSTKLADALADERVHAIIISSPTNTHFELCKDALSAGRHVFTEKPISHDPEELKLIVELATASKKAFIRRRLPAPCRSKFS